MKTLRAVLPRARESKQLTEVKSLGEQILGSQVYAVNAVMQRMHVYISRYTLLE